MPSKKSNTVKSQKARWFGKEDGVDAGEFENALLGVCPLEKLVELSIREDSRELRTKIEDAFAALSENGVVRKVIDGIIETLQQRLQMFKTIPFETGKAAQILERARGRLQQILE